MKILYLSCHSILEYEEVLLLHELGHEVFSPGAYVEPANPGDASLRPSIPGLKYSPDILEQWHKVAVQHPGEDTKDYLTKEFVDNFDCVIIMHLPRWVTRNWQVMKHKRVIWRTIGQSIAKWEQQLAQARNEGMEIVRYSPNEERIPNYLGRDALIRFYKDPEQYKDWSGDTERVITFAQDMQQRDTACNFTFFEEVTRPYQRILFGPGSEGLGWGAGKVPYEQLVQELRENRVYFYTGTHPASYTLNFIEAWMTGIPVVAVGAQHGNANYFPGHEGLYEVDTLIKNCHTGFVSDDLQELRGYITSLLENKSLAEAVGVNARQEAIRLFGKGTIMQQWKDYLGE